MTIARLIPIAWMLTVTAGCDLDVIDPIDTASTDSTDETDTAPQGCADLCARADSAGTDDGACVSQELQDLGYDIVNAPRECAAIAGNETGCLACMSHLEVTDEDCVTVQATCF